MRALWYETSPAELVICLLYLRGDMPIPLQSDAVLLSQDKVVQCAKQSCAG